MPLASRHLTRAAGAVLATVVAATGTVTLAGPAAAATCTRTRPCTSTLTAVAATTLPVNTVGAVSGYLRTGSGSALAGRVITLQGRDVAADIGMASTPPWRTLARVTTNRYGRWTFNAKRTGRIYYRALYTRTTTSTYKSAISATRFASVTYPTYIAPAVTYRLTKCSYVARPDEESIDIRAEFAVDFLGGRYQINHPWSDPTYYWDGHEHSDAGAILTTTNETYEPNGNYTFPVNSWEIPFVYKPGAPASGDWIETPASNTRTLNTSQCTAVPSL